MGSPFSGQDLLVNQRSAPRVVFHRKGQLLAADGKAIPIKTFNISASGIGFISPHPVASKQICALNVFTLHNAFPELTGKGVAAYCMLSGTQGYRVGLEYTEVHPDAESLIDRIAANALL